MIRAALMHWSLAGGFCVLSAGEPLLAKFDFEDGKTAGWSFSDPKAFEIVAHAEGKALGLVRPAEYKPKVRSPLAYALLDDVVVSDFVLDVKMKSTVKDYPHRDLCLFFGFRDREHFYYVHLAKVADPHANSIFRVDGSPRISIAVERTTGTLWDDKWHRVRLTYSAATGDAAVYFDDMAKPVMKARDKTFTWGKVGVGSFDDLGWFDDFELHGVGRKR